MRASHLILSVLATSLTVLAQAKAPAKAVAAKVLSFTPSGEIKSPQQIRVRFSEAMIPLGQPRAEAPINGECLKGGSGRWIDSQNWVYDFDKALASGNLCRFQLKSGLKTLNGKEPGGAREFSFSTGGPAIVGTIPQDYDKIDENQNFVFFFDAELGDKEPAAFFVVEGLGDRIPARFASGSEKEKILWAAATSHRWQEYVKIKKNKLESPYASLVLKADRPFPAGAKVSVVWEKGLRSRSGVATAAALTNEFAVRDAFQAKLTCDREKPGAPCLPLLPISLTFTEGISSAQVAGIYLQDSAGRKIPTDNQVGDRRESVGSLYFKGPFEPNATYKLFLPAHLKDQTGRGLVNADQFPLAVKTADMPPLLKFAAPFGVIEAGPEAALPVTVRQIEKQISARMAHDLYPLKGQGEKLGADSFGAIIQRLGALDNSSYGTMRVLTKGKSLQIAKPHGEKDFEVIGIPLPETGLYTYEMESPRLGRALTAEEKSFFVRSTALVTHLGVHLKYTENEAFVWVTRLQDAQVVPGAQVQIYTCDGKVAGAGQSDAQGVARIALKKKSGEVRCEKLGIYGVGFFAVARLGTDFSFVHSSWTRGIETWRFQVDTGDGEKSYAHTLMDRTLLRPGETLSMKHILREPRARGLALMSAAQLPTEMEIEHESGEQKFTQKLTWTKNGTSLSTWKIPEGAKLGRWQISLVGKNIHVLSGDVRIENFRIPVMKGQIQLPTAALVGVSKVPVQIGVEYLAGGPAGELEMKLRWKTDEAFFAPENDEFQSYSFLNGGVKEGVSRQQNDEDDEVPGAPAETFDKNLKLDRNGGTQIDVGNLKLKDKAKTLRLEAEYRDPNGEVQTLSRQATLWPSDYVIGIKPTSWSATKDRLSFSVVVLDTQKQPVAKAPVEVILYEQNYLSHRKKLVGGFYAYEDFREVKKIARFCQGVTDARGTLVCDGKSPIAGTVVAVASTKDGKGRAAVANTNQYVVNSETELWFGANDNDRADIIPNKKSFEPGETALFQLRTPFQTQKVLLTLEREGVVDYQIVDVSAKDPTLKLKIKPEWAPNVFVNAFAIRGRIGDVQPTALLDLGKPAFKMALTEIKVGWKKHELKVQVATDKKTYRVREEAKAEVTVTDSNKKPVAGEITVAVVDEGLLELRPNDSWKILPAMMRSHSLTVTTATAQTQVVGKRHFGLKALAAGGDGRGSGSRELFETLLLWKGTLPLDKAGHAQFKIPINDSLTSFRVVVMAINGVDQFGTGAVSFQTTQDLMIFAGLPQEAREGDRLMAEYTVRNVTAVPQDLKLDLQVGGASAPVTQKIQLKPNESKEVVWPVKVPVSSSELSYRMTATDVQGRRLDEIVKKQKIVPLWPTQVQQAVLKTVQGELKQEIAPVENAVPGTAEWRLEMSSSLAGSREGIRKFWKNYVYNCLEQQISRAISLNDVKIWNHLDLSLETYFDEKGLLKFFPTEKEGSEILSSYALSVAHERGFHFSEAHEKRLLEAVANFVSAKDDRSERLAMADRDVRRLYAVEALSRYRRLKPEMLTAMKLTPEQWPTSALVIWYQILILEKKLPRREALLSQAENLIRARMYFAGTGFSFSDEKQDQYWWLLSSTSVPLHRLILAVANLPQWKDDVPKLARASLSRQRQGNWEMTTANAWGVLAFDRYRELFEKQKVEGHLIARLAGQEKNWNWKQSEGVIEFPASAKTETLSLKQEGAGTPYVTVNAVAAVPVTQPLSSGFAIEKSVEAVQRKISGRWSRGDIVKVKLKIRSMADTGWVVINDPLPSGASVLGGGLGRDSALLAEDAGGVNDLWMTFQERTPTSTRMYYYWFPKGNFEVEYRLRLNQAGEFQMSGTRVEAMYNPSLFGVSPNALWKVEL